jgi:amidohydrolase
VTIGMINGGVRNNIIPDSVVLVGTVRTLDAGMQKDVHARIARTAESIAAASGASASVRVSFGYPVTVNDEELTRWAVPTLERAAGSGKAYVVPPELGAEDFSYFARQVPGLYVFLGIVPEGQNPDTAPTNHSPLFFADEAALPVGVKALAGLALDYLAKK